MGRKAGMGAILGAAAGGAIAGPVGAAALGGAGLQAGAGMESAEEALEAAKKQRYLQNLQAEEVLRRVRWNIDVKEKEKIKTEGAQALALAASGIDISSQSGLLAMEEASAAYKSEMFKMQNDANWEANQIRLGGQMAVDAAKKQLRGAQLSAIGGFGMAAAQTYMMSSNKPPTSSGVDASGGSGLGQTSGPNRMTSGY